MKQWRTYLRAAGLGLMGVAASVNAQSYLPTLPGLTGNPAEYRAQELSFGTVGTDAMSSQATDPLYNNRIKSSSPLGTGGTVNYFFNRHLGIGVNAYSKDSSHNFVDTTSGNLIARFPIADTGIAPYVFGGSSYRFDNVGNSYADAGAGLEIRFPHQTAAVLDVSYVLPDKIENNGIGRLGLRFNF